MTNDCTQCGDKTINFNGICEQCETNNRIRKLEERVSKLERGELK